MLISKHQLELLEVKHEQLNDMLFVFSQIEADLENNKETIQASQIEMNVIRMISELLHEANGGLMSLINSSQVTD